MLIRGEDSAIDLPSTLTGGREMALRSVWLFSASAGGVASRSRTDA